MAWSHSKTYMLQKVGNISEKDSGTYHFSKVCRGPKWKSNGCILSPILQEKAIWWECSGSCRNNSTLGNIDQTHISGDSLDCQFWLGSEQKTVYRSKPCSRYALWSNTYYGIWGVGSEKRWIVECISSQILVTKSARPCHLQPTAGILSLSRNRCWCVTRPWWRW